MCSPSELLVRRQQRQQRQKKRKSQRQYTVMGQSWHVHWTGARVVSRCSFGGSRYCCCFRNSLVLATTGYRQQLAISSSSTQSRCRSTNICCGCCCCCCCCQQNARGSRVSLWGDVCEHDGPSSFASITAWVAHEVAHCIVSSIHDAYQLKLTGRTFEGEGKNEKELHEQSNEWSKRTPNGLRNRLSTSNKITADSGRPENNESAVSHTPSSYMQI